MRKIYIPVILIIISIMLIACSNQDGNKGQPFDPMESSIFRMADVKNVRVLEGINVKSGASESYNTIATLSPGDVVSVLGKIDNWYVVRLENYQIGCIDSRKTEPVVVDNQETQIPRPAEPERPDSNADDEADQRPAPPDQTGDRDTETDRDNRRDTTPEQPGIIEQPNEPDQAEEPQRPTTPDNVDTGQENQLLNLINQERNKNGLSPLQSDTELRRVARIKAQDMLDNNYFSHYSPTYGSPFDMMDEFGVDYQYAGENLSKNTTVDQAHTALMNSSGHRKNILNPNFTHVGIGIKQAERGYIYVEMFIGAPR